MSNVFVTSCAIEAALVPVLIPCMDEATFGFKGKDRPGARRTVTLRASVGGKTRATKKSFRVRGRIGRVGVYGGIRGEDG